MMKAHKFSLGRAARTRLTVGAALLLVAGRAPQAFAWSAGGHMTVATIAYSQLAPSTKTKVDALLAMHPDTSKWMAERTATDPPLDQYFFMRASLWPDEIRRSGSPYDHPNWHFVDYPLGAPYQQVPDDIASPFPADDVLFGIANSETVLQGPKPPTVDGGASLSWLIHLVGDIHQPLHCATLIKDPEFPAPKGDLGGNGLYVTPTEDGAEGDTTKLHTYWDRLPSDPTIPYDPHASDEVRLANQSKEVQYANRQALDLRHRFPRKAFGVALTNRRTVRAWSLDCSRLALTAAYENGQLPISTDSHQGSPLDATYIKRAHSIADKQVTLAGYRLADELNRLLP